MFEGTFSYVATYLYYISGDGQFNRVKRIASVVGKTIAFSTWRDIFKWAFYLKSQYFVLTDHILSDVISLSVSVLCSKIFYPLIKFMAKNWSDMQCQ